jgi:hypothetical protein
MKRIVTLLALVSALAVTATAGAYAHPPVKHTCAPVWRQFTYQLQEFGTTCATARALERYNATHELADVARIHVAGQWWWPNLVSRRGGHTWYTFANGTGRAMVFDTTRYPVS